MGPSEPRGWPRRVVWHSKHFHTVYLGATHPYHALGPLNGPLRHSWGPQKGSFLARMPPIGPSRLDSWSPHTFTWYRAPSGPPGVLKGPISARNAPFGALGGPRGARFGPNCPPLARLGWTHAHHTLSPGIGPFWAPGDPKG